MFQQAHAELAEALNMESRIQSSSVKSSQAGRTVKLDERSCQCEASGAARFANPVI